MLCFGVERSKVTGSVSSFFTRITITHTVYVNAHLTDNSNTAWV